MNVESEVSDPRALVSRLWSYCELLRHSGVSTLDYVEQLTYLLFLKMADERSNRRLNPEHIVPDGLGWPSLINKAADDLLDQYEYILAELGRKSGMLGAIFRGARNKIQEPAVLERLVKDLIDKHRWSNEDTDVKGDAYEGLLQRGAEDRKTGAGQYFTPRAVIDTMVDCMQPGPKDSVFDPACGTGGFLIAAHRYIVQNHSHALDSNQPTGAELWRNPRCRTRPGDGPTGIDEHAAARHRASWRQRTDRGQRFTREGAEHSRGHRPRQPPVRGWHRHGRELRHVPYGSVDRDHQQAAQFRSAHLHAAETERPLPP